MAENYFDIKEQTEKWLQMKWAMFSASDIHLLTDKSSGTKMFGKGAATYILKVARQACSLFNSDDKIDTHDMRMGKLKETACAHFYKQMIGLDSIEHHGDYNPLFHPYNEHSGVSPDALAKKSDGTISFGSEFKNPSADTHFRYLFEIDSQWDLKAESEKYYAQCQFSMMAFKTDLWHWVSYNEYMNKPSQKMLIIEIQEDKRYQDNLEIRLASAIRIKKKIVEMINNGYKGKIDINNL